MLLILHFDVLVLNPRVVYAVPPMMNLVGCC